MIPFPPTFAAYCWLTPEDDPVPPLLALLQSAQRRILVSAFGFTLAPVVDELIAAHTRGVDTRLILDSYQAQGAAEKVQISRLQKAGVPMLIGTSERGAIIHLKTFLVDDAIWGGSWNVSESANKQDNEVYLLMVPPGFSSRHVAKFEAEWARLTAKADKKKSTRRTKAPAKS